MAAARVLLLQGGRPRPVGFARSVCGRLGAAPGPGPWPAHCDLQRGRLVLSDRPFPGASVRLPLQRPLFCPFAALDPQPAPPAAELPGARGVDLGVAVVLQSSDRTVLLTRRAGTLSVSPNLWVPPGGHAEPDEELLDGGLRELWEETGLRLCRGQFTWVPLGLWESAYPPRLSWGLPKYHHIVLYLLVVSRESQQQLQARIQPNPSEVSALTWLGPDVAAVVAASEDRTETPGPRLQGLPPSVPSSAPAAQPRRPSPVPLSQGDKSFNAPLELLSAVGVEADGGTRPLALPVGTLLRTTPVTAEANERVSTGTKFALGLWLKHLGGAML